MVILKTLGTNLYLLFQPSDVVDPLDYEEFMSQHQLLIDRDPLRNILDFPSNDIVVCEVPRKVRTQELPMPKESL